MLSPKEKHYDMEKWNGFLQQCPMGSIFQSTAWEVQKSLNGWKSDLIILRDTTEIRSGAMVYRKHLPLIRHCILEVPYGPVWRYPDNGGELGFIMIINEILLYARQNKGIFLDIDAYAPPLFLSNTGGGGEDVDNILLKKGFFKINKTFGTYILDLRESEQSVFKQLKKKFRRDIKKAQRENVHVSINKKHETNFLLEKFYYLYVGTFSRKKMVPYKPDFFFKGIIHLINQDLCRIFSAEIDNTIHNMAIISLLGHPTYIWGASSGIKGLPPTGQLLHWEIIRWLKHNRYCFYDLGGSPGPIPIKEHPNYGVWNFKYGFNGKYCESHNRYRYVLNRPLFKLYQNLTPIMNSNIRRRLFKKS